MGITATFQQAAARLEQGRLDEAEELVKRILTTSPDHPDGSYLLGIISLQRGLCDAAIQWFECAIKANPGHPLYHYNLGLALQRTGQWKMALTHYEMATGFKPDFVEAHKNRGAALLRLERVEEALAAYEQVVQLNPNLPEVHRVRCAIFMQQGRLEEALSACDKLIRLNPALARSHSNRGAVLRAMGRLEAALAATERAIQLDPEFAEGYSNHGIALWDLGLQKEALEAFERAIQLNPELADAHNNCGTVLKKLGQIEDAETCYRRAIGLKPGYSEAYSNLGTMLREQARLEEAETNFRRALELKPDSYAAYNGLGNTLRNLGRFEDAEECYRCAVKLKPDYSEAYYNLLGMIRVRPDDSLITTMEGLYADSDAVPESRMHLGFALGKAYSDLKCYTKAIPYYENANRIKRASLGDQVAEYAEREEHLRNIFTPEFVSRHAATGLADDTPVFIVGMPRSGTTLVEQIVASHPQVTGAGELPFVPALANQVQTVAAQNSLDWLRDADNRVLHSLGSEYLRHLRLRGGSEIRHITDKLPENLWYVGFIRLILPQARIIHVRRDARDTCLSIYTHWFGGHHPYAYDLKELGEYYRHYASMMEHWKKLYPGMIYEVAYEELVEDLEPQVRGLLAYCGLPFDAQCLAFYETKRAVKTASYAQVRRAIYQSSVGRWKHFEQMLQPLLSVLEPGPDD